MAKAQVKFDSILGGMAPSKYFTGEGQYNSGIAIDPDLPAGSEIRTTGVIVPVIYEKFSDSLIDDYPMWIFNTTKDDKTYVYLADGPIRSYDDSLGSETNVGTPTNGNGSGAAYYNNYAYFATTTDISRYGPLDGTPSLTNNFWSSTLSLTALTDTTYPSLRGVEMPNHAMHAHSDGSLYICDFKDGQGIIHRLNTKKSTYEGEIDGTTVPSAYNVLDLPFGYYPTDIESYGTDLVISAIQTTDADIMQGKAALFFWDATSASFYRQVPVADPLVTALINVNGLLYVFSGNAQKGMRLSVYAGGDSLQQVAFLEEGAPPFAGSVEAWANKIYFGTWITYPEEAGVVFAFGSKNAELPQGFHCVIRTTSTGANPMVTAIKHVQQASNVTPQMVVGWGDDSAKGLDKRASSGTYDSIIRFRFVNIGQKFKIEKIKIPVGKAVATNMTITPKIYVDDNVDGTSPDHTLAVINDTNYSGKRNIVYKNPKMKVNPEHNFMLELNFAGTVELPVLFPISIDLDILDDE